MAVLVDCCSLGSWPRTVAVLRGPGAGHQSIVSLPVVVLCRMLAELLIRVVQATAAGLDIQPRGQLEAELPREDLVPPMTAGNYETNTSFCWLGVRSGRADKLCLVPVRGQQICQQATAVGKVLGGLLLYCLSLRPSTSPLMQDDFHGLIDKAEGFAWINERPEATERKAQVGVAQCRRAAIWYDLCCYLRSRQLPYRCVE